LKEFYSNVIILISAILQIQNGELYFPIQR